MAITSVLKPSEPTASPPTDTQLVYDGSFGELLWLWIKILLLGFITLGIYSRFWGRTRIRKYFWNHVSLLGERFEYDGTGGELFRRFLLAVIGLPLGFFLVAGVVFLLGRYVLPQGIGVALGVIAEVALIFGFFFIIFLAQYGSGRYQVSRTLWHGIRGGVEGSAASYAFRAIGWTLLIPLTLGLCAPWRDVGLYRYRTNHTGFGDVDFHFEGSGGALMGAFLVYYGCRILAFIVAAAVGALIFLGLNGGFPSGGDFAQVSPGATVGAVLGFYVAFLGVIIAGWLHYVTRSIAYTTANTRFGRVSFEFPLGKGELFWFIFSNFLLFVFTAGLALPFVAQRAVRFFCNHLRIYNANELISLTQAPGRRERKGGEGLAQLFDTLDLGGFI